MGASLPVISPSKYNAADAGPTPRITGLQHLRLKLEGWNTKARRCDTQGTGGAVDHAGNSPFLRAPETQESLYLTRGKQRLPEQS